MLSFLLFAGALHTDLQKLKGTKMAYTVFCNFWRSGIYFAHRNAVYFLLQGIGLEVLFINCLLFGALISPTDPIAVLGILKKANVPKKAGNQDSR